MLQKRCHLKCFRSPWWSLQSRLESSCVCRRELWTPAQGRSAEAGGRTQQDGFVSEVIVLWSCSWADQNFPAILWPWQVISAPSPEFCQLHPCGHAVLCSRSPGRLSGWQQGHEKLQSVEVPCVGQLIFKIHVKPLWNCTHHAEACLVTVNMQWMKSGPGETTSNTHWWSRARISLSVASWEECHLFSFLLKC